MKATIEFEDDLYRQLKATAALRGRKIRELVNEAVRKSLQEPWSAVVEEPASEWPMVVAKRKKPLAIPDDVASRLDSESDSEGYASSLR